jgi:hypothetical protein
LNNHYNIESLAFWKGEKLSLSLKLGEIHFNICFGSKKSANTHATLLDFTLLKNAQEIRSESHQTPKYAPQNLYRDTTVKKYRID